MTLRLEPNSLRHACAAMPPLSRPLLTLGSSPTVSAMTTATSTSVPRRAAPWLLWRATATETGAESSSSS